MNRRYAPPPVQDLSSTTGLSLCSSPSTITCSVWSSGRSMVSSFDVLSTILPMSTITFSSAISDDEDDITLDHTTQQPPQRSSFCDGHSSSPTLHHQQHTTTSIDPFALSERSLFQDPTRRIDPTKKIDYAPMAPPRQQQQQGNDVGATNQKWTTSPSPPSGKLPLATNKDSKPGFIDHGGCLDVKPRMPTRSFHGDEDHVDCNEPTLLKPNNSKDQSLAPSQTLDPSLSWTRRDRLVKRLAAVHRIVDAPETTPVGCRIAPIFDMSNKSDPPKLPIRTTHDDMTETVVSDDDDYDSGDDFACDVVEDISPVSKVQSFDCVVIDDDHDNDGELQIIMDERCQQHEESGGSSSCSSQEKQMQPSSTSKERKKKQKASKAATPKSSTTNKKKAAASKEADPQELLTTTTKTSIMDPPVSGRRRSTGSSTTSSTVGRRRAAKRSLRPRSKDPPQRFATAPASLSSNGDDSNRKNYITKRRVRTNKSSSSERRNRRQFVSNSLASILEDENENTTSPTRGEPKAPASCPSAIETSGLEERYDSILDLENRFASKTRGGRSWAGTASRNLL